MSMKLLLPLTLSMALLCQSADATTPEVRKVQASPAQTPASSGRASTLTQSYCYLRVNGVVRIDNICNVYLMGDGGYTLNSWDRGKPEKSHFAVVSVTGNGKADATWNADPNDDRAMDPLGQVTMKRGCWENARARICTRKGRRAH